MTPENSRNLADFSFGKCPSFSRLGLVDPKTGFRHLQQPRKPGSHIELRQSQASCLLVAFSFLAESMIYRRVTKKKMGQAFSKKKQKQKAEGLFTQQSNFVKEAVKDSPTPEQSVAPKKGTPPSPRPHGQIQSTLDNPVMTSEFLVFLQKLDKADMLDDDECGRASELEFVLAVQQLETGPEEETADLVHTIGVKYFKQDGLDLDNKELWTRCSEACSELKVTESGINCLKDAHDKCLDKLDSVHLVFLQKYRAQTCTSQIISCLL